MSKYRLVVFFFTLLVLSSSSSATASSTPPDSQQVREEHQRLLKRYDLKETRGIQGDLLKRPLNKRASQSYLDFLAWLKRLSLPVMMILIVILILLFYFFFRASDGLFPGGSRLPVLHFSQEGNGAPRAAHDTTAEMIYARAMALAGQGQWGKALVLLHQASLKKLQFLHMVPPGDHFTNNQVQQILLADSANPSTAAGFGQLASVAERTTFKGEEPPETTFFSLKTLYDRVFLNLGNK